VSDVLNIQEKSGIAPIKKPLTANRTQNSEILHRFELIEDEIMLGIQQIDLI
jgi:hypothetical protein